MAHDLFDAMVGADRSAIITMVSPKGQQKRVHRSQYGKLVKQGWRLVQPAATRPMQVPGYSQPGYPQQPMLQAQPYGQPGATILPGQPGYPYLPGQPGYGSPAPTNYGAQGPVNYGPQGYQGPPSYSAPDQGAGPYPDEGGGDDQGLDQDQDGDASLGLAAAVGEATALGTEQYATVGGGVDITRWLVDPWDAATADAAHKLMAVASGLTQASMANRFTAQRMIAALKSQSAKGNPLAQRAMIKFGSITQMVAQGQSAPSIVLAQRSGQPVLAVARPQFMEVLKLQQRGAQQKAALDRAILAEKTRAAFNAQKADYAAQIADLNKQLERRDWSDETRKQLEDQAADYEKKLAAMAPGAPAAEADPDALEADDAPLAEGGDFDADVAGADGA